jgi:hypothetical protein
VECKRIDGKPRQQVVKHIGSIVVYDRINKCSRPQVLPCHLQILWEEFDYAVSQLNLDKELVQKLSHELTSYGFTRPTEEEIEQWEIYQEQSDQEIFERLEALLTNM